MKHAKDNGHDSVRHQPKRLRKKVFTKNRLSVYEKSRVIGPRCIRVPTQNFRPSLDIRPESATTRGKISGVKNLASWCGIADSMAIPKIPEYDNAKKKKEVLDGCQAFEISHEADCSVSLPKYNTCDQSRFALPLSCSDFLQHSGHRHPSQVPKKNREVQEKVKESRM